jgi:dipeptidyl-peptidase-4
LKFAEALVQANKQFDLMLYPNRAHPITGGNTSLHLYTKMTNFFVCHLQAK